MNFASDNVWGVPGEIVKAVAEANGGPAAAYGGDGLSKSLNDVFCDVFEREVRVVPVATGIACNALSAALYAPPHGAVLCHEHAHINTSECGAAEFFTGGAKLVAVVGAAGKLSADALERRAAEFDRMDTHRVQPALASITQATEFGTVYGLDEIGAIGEAARRQGLALHMDGARFANALASLGASPADMTWRAGVDILSFGCTKNGSLSADAIIMFDPAREQELLFRRKRAGHELSKSRFMAAQLLAYVQDGLWLEMARRANGTASLLGAGIEAARGARLAFPVQANEVFAVVDKALNDRLKAAGAVYHEWPGEALREELGAGPDELVIRLVASFETPRADTERFVELLKSA